MTDLKELIEALSATAETDAALTAQYVEVRRNEHEVILGGNRQGLTWLALQCLKLAEGQRGSHIHVDEHSNAEVCDVPLVIRHWTQP